MGDKYAKIRFSLDKGHGAQVRTPGDAPDDVDARIHKARSSGPYGKPYSDEDEMNADRQDRRRSVPGIGNPPMPGQYDPEDSQTYSAYGQNEDHGQIQAKKKALTHLRARASSPNRK